MLIRGSFGWLLPVFVWVAFIPLLVFSFLLDASYSSSLLFSALVQGILDGFFLCLIVCFAISIFFAILQLHVGCIFAGFMFVTHWLG